MNIAAYENKIQTRETPNKDKKCLSLVHRAPAPQTSHFVCSLEATSKEKKAFTNIEPGPKDHWVLSLLSKRDQALCDSSHNAVPWGVTHECNLCLAPKNS